MVRGKQFEKGASNAMTGEVHMRENINQGKHTGLIVNGLLRLADFAVLVPMTRSVYARVVVTLCRQILDYLYLTCAIPPRMVSDRRGTEVCY